jgi:uncharacterized protein (DUF1330 family)
VTTASVEIESLVTRLVGLHGEGGLAPTAADWRRIFEVTGEGPLTVVNLLGFHPTAASSQGSVTGEQAYRRYTRATAGAFERVGGELLSFGAVAHGFGLGDHGDWDAVVVTRYPSARALADMWLDDEFVAAHADRRDGVARSHVLVSAG